MAASTSRTLDNSGRHFWRCKVPEDMGGCKHFSWEDSIPVDKMVAAKIKKPPVDRDTPTSRITRDTVKFDLQFKLMEAKNKIDLLEVLLKESKEKQSFFKANLRDTQHEKNALKEKLKFWKIISAMLMLFIISMYFAY
ncbi:uncharacterized protein LOC132621607 [Lycium barbarum]|uniref:uncharacterized protein LOC132621607 n=1 Tax=Lycium barbarum TaxID=112863 RepID=UPI00293F4621|nr:uncharacterized protein LOC132621607 [Lycium barbarum]